MQRVIGQALVNYLFDMPITFSSFKMHLEEILVKIIMEVLENGNKGFRCLSLVSWTFRDIESVLVHKSGAGVHVDNIYFITYF